MVRQIGIEGQELLSNLNAAHITVFIILSKTASSLTVYSLIFG